VGFGFEAIVWFWTVEGRVSVNDDTNCTSTGQKAKIQHCIVIKKAENLKSQPKDPQQPKAPNPHFWFMVCRGPVGFGFEAIVWFWTVEGRVSVNDDTRII
jgi:hypothetical protein